MQMTIDSVQDHTSVSICSMNASQACKNSSRDAQQVNLKHAPGMKKRFYCPQASLSLYFQCRDDIPELKYTFWD